MTIPNNSETKHVPQDVKDIIVSGRIGIIANAIAQKLEIDPMEALEMFYESNTCRRLHNEETGLYLYSDLYLVDEFMLEMQGKQ